MTENIHVLYVDDEPSLLEIGKLFLEESGEFLVETINSAPNALDLLNNEKFDAIISDYQMPGMDGIKFLIEVRKKFGQVPFILFTGKGREDVVIEAINNGVDFYLQKGGAPVAQFAELSNKIKYAVSRKKAEEALLASVEELGDASSRYKALIAASNTGAWEYHEDSGFLWCSPEYFSMLGHDIGDFNFTGSRNIEQTWIELLHPDDRDTAINFFENYLKNPEGMYEQYFRMKHKEGHEIWVWSRGKTLRDANGDPTNITVGTHIDITDRKKADEAIRESEERYKAISEHSHNAICIIDEQGKITWANDKLVNLGGYSKEQLFHSESFLSFLAPESIEFVLTNFQKFVAGSQYEHHYQFYFIRKDGGKRLCEKYMMDVRDTQGRRSLIISMLDITDQENAKISLQQSEQKYRNLIEYANESIIVAQNGKLKLVNPQTIRMTGYKESELLSKPFSDFIYPEDRAMVVDRYQKRMSGEKAPSRYTFRFNRKDKSTRWVEISAVDIDWEGEPGTLNFLIDITDRKGTEEKIKYQTEAMEAAMDGIAILDREQQYIYLNKAHAQIYGYNSPGDLIGKSWEILYDTTELQRFQQEIMPEFGLKGYYFGKARGKRKDGTLFPQELSLTALDNGGLISIIRDITDWNRNQN